MMSSETEIDELRSRVQTVEYELDLVRQRNARVEVNKRWETSVVRLLCVTGVTYITMVLVFWVLGSRRPLIDAIVPTTGYFLSTLSLPIVRAWWERQK